MLKAGVVPSEEEKQNFVVADFEIRSELSTGFRPEGTGP